MELNEQGLPKPGRELDAAVWQMLGHEVEWRWCVGVDGRWHDLHAEVEEYYQRTTQPLATRHKKMPCYKRTGSAFWIPIPLVSTTHAFFQVMEVKRGEWLFAIEVYDDGVLVNIQDEQLRCLAVVNLDYKGASIEAATAHAVCCCAWKGTGAVVAGTANQGRYGN